MRPRQTFQQLIAANKRNSVFLIAGMFAFLLLLGAVFGGAYGGFEWGLLIAAVTAVIVFLAAWFGGSGTLLAVSGARRLEKADDPQLFNVVEEMSIAARNPDARKSTSSIPPRRMRLLPGSTPPMRPWRSPKGCGKS